MARRKWDTGLVRPYRPAPADFRETYLRIGWDGIEEHYRTNSRCIARWIEECGGDELRLARARITGQQLRPRRRSKRAKLYVLGLKSRMQASWPCDAPRFWDCGLIRVEEVEMPMRRRPSRVSVAKAVRILEMAAKEADAEYRAGLAKAAELLAQEGLTAVSAGHGEG